MTLSPKITKARPLKKIPPSDAERDKVSKIVPKMKSEGVNIRRDQQWVYFKGKKYSYKQFLSLSQAKAYAKNTKQHNAPPSHGKRTKSLTTAKSLSNAKRDKEVSRLVLKLKTAGFDIRHDQRWVYSKGKKYSCRDFLSLQYQMRDVDVKIIDGKLRLSIGHISSFVDFLDQVPETVRWLRTLYRECRRCQTEDKPRQAEEKPSQAEQAAKTQLIKEMRGRREREEATQPVEMSDEERKGRLATIKSGIVPL